MVKKIWGLFFVLLTACMVAGTAYGDGTEVTDALRIKAVINTEEKGPVEAVWQQGGEDWTGAGDHVIWGYFYASPDDVTWGSMQNPDVFVKIWFDRGGRTDVNFFHVSVPDIEVYSDYLYDAEPEQRGTLTTLRRHIRQYYEDGRSHMEKNYENGEAPRKYDPPTGNPSVNFVENDLRIGTVINTKERGGIQGVWKQGGEDRTPGGHHVIWGYVYANPDDVNWGSSENPELFVKIWFDAGGRLDVNFFHVSVPDIEVYSGFPDNSVYDQKGTAILTNRYIRHEYCYTSGFFTQEPPPPNCGIPSSGNVFSNDTDEITAWVRYCDIETGKPYEFRWHSPEGVLAQSKSGTWGENADRGCSWKPISTAKLMNYEPGQWKVEFIYDNRLVWDGDFTFAPGEPEDFQLTDFVLTAEALQSNCQKPAPQTAFSENDEKIVAWADYRSFRAGKSYEFKWYRPDGIVAQTNRGNREVFSNGCSYGEISAEVLRAYDSGQWRVEFFYDALKYGEKSFTFTK